MKFNKGNGRIGLPFHAHYMDDTHRVAIAIDMTDKNLQEKVYVPQYKRSGAWEYYREQGVKIVAYTTLNEGRKHIYKSLRVKMTI